MHPPGPLLASGRDSDIFEYGDGTVLRRSRRSRSMEVEARVMDHVRALGYPVPAVVEMSADGTDLVMERVDGPVMVELLGRKPWLVPSMGAVLADLHLRLHELEGPGWLPPAPLGSGDRLLHMDLHPLNVILSPRGPVVIDWPNVARGDPGVDVALTWALLACGGVPMARWKARALGWVRSALVRRFVAGSGPDSAAGRRLLAEVSVWKARDPNLTPTEVAALKALALRYP